MSILVIGSVAFDNVETPFGKVERALGGSATHFSMSASYFTDVHLVATVGEDFPQAHIDLFNERKIDLAGFNKVKGKTFEWSGKYGFDLNNAQTLKTDLNVFQHFEPVVPEKLKNINYLFLANIDPDLQSKVIDQVNSAKVIACDTMNFWIEGKRDALIKTLSRVNILIINDAEARLLARESNLVKASKVIRSYGPQILIIKQGEYGALLFQDDLIFSAPGLPLEEIKDPTGAGDSFAGGFFGYISKTDDVSFTNLKKAVIFGSVMASYNVEDFSCDRLRRISQNDIDERFKIFKNLAHFDA